MWNNYAYKKDIFFFFFVAFGVVELLQPFIHIFVLIVFSYLKAFAGFNASFKHFKFQYHLVCAML